MVYWKLKLKSGQYDNFCSLLQMQGYEYHGVSKSEIQVGGELRDAETYIRNGFKFRYFLFFGYQKGQNHPKNCTKVDLFAHVGVFRNMENPVGAAVFSYNDYEAIVVKELGEIGDECKRLGIGENTYLNSKSVRSTFKLAEGVGYGELYELVKTLGYREIKPGKLQRKTTKSKSILWLAVQHGFIHALCYCSYSEGGGGNRHWAYNDLLYVTETLCQSGQIIYLGLDDRIADIYYLLSDLTEKNFRRLIRNFKSKVPAVQLAAYRSLRRWYSLLTNAEEIIFYSIKVWGSNSNPSSNPFGSVQSDLHNGLNFSFR